MRLWSIHPQYLDAKGLVALWREGLLAKAVLEGKTKGYRHHPQLERFERRPDPVVVIVDYLTAVWQEAEQRGYRFDRGKLADGKSSSRSKPQTPCKQRLTVTDGQLIYEWQHLLDKLKRRDPERYRCLKKLALPKPHPLMRVVPGPVASWEVIPNKG